MMRRFSFVLLVVFLSFLSGCAASGPGPKELIGKMAPWTKFTTLEGGWLSIEELRGKTAVVVFWASWCAKSRKKLSRLGLFAEQFAGRSDVVFVDASIDKAEKLEDVQNLITYGSFGRSRHCFSGNEYYDEAYISFRGDELPYIIIINPDGQVVDSGNDDEMVYKYFGVDPDSVPRITGP